MSQRGRNPFKPYLVWLIVVTILAFVLNKHVIREWVVLNFPTGALTIVVNSLSNFVEAILGTITITGFLLYFKECSRGSFAKIADQTVYWSATLIAAIFVILSEVNLITFRGKNVYDPYDVVASILGLILINRLMIGFGYLSETNANSASLSSL